MAKQLNEDIKVFGLFGFPLSHTVSPSMQNAALRELGIPGIYLAFERNKKEFQNLVRRKVILDGFNLTIPHKETVLPYLDSLDRSAKQVGAVNTVKRVGSRFIGYNTDVYGFKESLKEAGFLRAKGKKAVLLGAGGAARAVVVALKDLGLKRIAIYNRTASKSTRLAKEFKVQIIKNESELRNEVKDADLLVNATSLGLKKSDPMPIAASVFGRKKMLIHDLIYGKQTKLLQHAKKLGLKAVDGEAMLLHQGARAFEIWTGKRAPIKVMRKALRDGLLAR